MGQKHSAQEQWVLFVWHSVWPTCQEHSYTISLHCSEAFPSWVSLDLNLYLNENSVNNRTVKVDVFFIEFLHGGGAAANSMQYSQQTDRGESQSLHRGTWYPNRAVMRKARSWALKGPQAKNLCRQRNALWLYVWTVRVCVWCACVWEEWAAAAVRGNAQLTTLSQGLTGEGHQPMLTACVCLCIEGACGSALPHIPTSACECVCGVLAKRARVWMARKHKHCPPVTALLAAIPLHHVCICMCVITFYSSFVTLLPLSLSLSPLSLSLSHTQHPNTHTNLHVWAHTLNCLEGSCNESWQWMVDKGKHPEPLLPIDPQLSSVAASQQP